MPELLIAVTVAALFGFCWVGVPRLIRRDLVVPESVPAAEILRRTEEECHREPTIPFTPVRAHREMQVLIDCDIRLCPRKNAAFWVIVDAGRATPAARAQR